MARGRTEASRADSLVAALLAAPAVGFELAGESSGIGKSFRVVET